MKQFLTKILAATLFVAIAGLAGSVQAAESKYANHTNTAAVLFGANPYGTRSVTAILAKSDKATAAVKLYAKGGAGKALITVAPTSGATVVTIADNTGNLFTTNDAVVYAHSDGTLLYTTVSGNTTNTVTLATGLTQAGAIGDALYEVTQQGELSLGTTALNLAGFTAFAVPPDSPLRAVADGNTNVTLTITVD